MAPRTDGSEAQFSSSELLMLSWASTHRGVLLKCSFWLNGSGVGPETLPFSQILLVRQPCLALRGSSFQQGTPKFVF